jgi:subtilisin-like proprotein convertase family protein/streptogramin lyase
VPIDIPDRGLITSTLTVPDALSIDDVNVQLNITHPHDADLDVYLRSPSGTLVELFTDVGGGGDNFENTILNDQAGPPITAGSAPFNGEYQPEGSLADFNGEDASGTWTLEIADDKRRNTGTLQSWSIEIGSSQLVMSISDVSLWEDGLFETFVSAGTGGLNGPKGIVLHSDGRLYAASSANDSILRFDGSTGAFVDVFVASGSGGLDLPIDLAFGADGDLYVSSGNTDEVLHYDGTTGSSSGAFVLAGDGGVDRPSDLLFGPDGNLYVSSAYTDEVLRYDGQTGAFLGVFVGDDPVTPGVDESGGLDHPTGFVFAPDGYFYLGGYKSNNVLRYDGTTGTYLGDFVPAGSGGLVGPADLDLGPDGHVYIASYHSQNVLRFDGTSGAFIDAMTPKNTAEILRQPRGLLFDSAGELHVSGTNSDNIMRAQDGLEVNLSSPSGLPVTVDFATSPETAVAGSDYTSLSGTLQFDAGETTKKILVSTIEDIEVEGTETFSVTLSNPTGDPTLSIGRGTGTATIIDDDAARQISINDVNTVEGDNAPHFREYFVDGWLGGHFNPITFGPDGNDDGISDLYTAVGTGTGYNTIQRYDGATGAFLDTFMANDGPHKINGVRDIVFHTDGYVYVASAYTDEVLRYDGDTGEFVDVFVEANSGGIDHPDGMVFADPDGNGIPELYVTGWLSHSVVRYNIETGEPIGTYIMAGSGGLSFPFALAFGPGDNNVYVTSAGTNQILKYNAVTGGYLGIGASTGLDYPRDVAFSDGLMYVTSGDNDRIIRFTADGTYVDDYVPAGSGGMDNPRSMVFKSGDLYVTMTGNREIFRFGTELEAVFTVSLSTTSSLPVSVDFATSNFTAEAGSDYTTTNGSLTFAPGVTKTTVLVPTLDDLEPETTETFTVSLENAMGGVISHGEGVATIMDDDGPSEFYDRALSGISVNGTVSGFLADTYSSNDQYQAITEERSNEKQTFKHKSLLEHRWEFNVTGGDTVTFSVEAHRTANSEGDDFIFAYSADGGATYIDMVTVATVVDTVQDFLLPHGISGTVYVRVKDTDRTWGNTALDTIYVDDMFFLSSNNNAGASAQQSAAAAADMALLAWTDLDYSDDDDATPLATRAAEELALMLFE